MSLHSANPRRPANIAEHDPVREFTGDHIQLSISLLRVLEQQRRDVAEMIAKGGVTSGSVANYDDYRFHCGRLDGIDIAIALCKEVQSKLGA